MASRVIDILMSRDDMDYESAKSLERQTTEEILECEGDYEEAVDIIANNLGLEPDYMVDLLGGM